MQIFSEHGFDIKTIGNDSVKSALNDWRKTIQMYGEDGILEEQNGKGSTGRPSTQHL